MRINRQRNFKNTVEITITLTGKECEQLSHIISAIDPDKLHKLGYAPLKVAGYNLLQDLNNQVFWTHWTSNFASKRFTPSGTFRFIQGEANVVETK